jgi:hypothetical protein
MRSWCVSKSHAHIQITARTRQAVTQCQLAPPTRILSTSPPATMIIPPRGPCLHCDRIRSDQIGSDQIRSDQIRSDQIRSDQIRSERVLKSHSHICIPTPNTHACTVLTRHETSHEAVHETAHKTIHQAVVTQCIKLFSAHETVDETIHDTVYEAMEQCMKQFKE